MMSFDDRSVPSLRVRYAGKTLPPEKYCLVRSEKYFRQKEALVLPAFVSISKSMSK